MTPNLKQKNCPQAKNKKKTSKISPIQLTCLSLIAIIIALFVCVIWFHFSLQDETIVAKVNHNKISSLELEAHMSFCKGEVASQLKEKYDVTLSQKNMEQKVDDVTVEEYWRDFAFEEVVRYKIEQALAVEEGILDSEDLNYKSWYAKFQNENESRAQKIEQGQVVYGAKQYTLQSYYNYTYTNMKLQLYDRLVAENVLDVSDKRLKQYYEENQSDYKAIDNYEFTCYYFTTDIPEDEVNAYCDALREQKEKAMSQSIADKVKVETISLNEDTYLDLSKASGEIYEQALSMQKNEVSQPIINGEYRVILFCDERQDGGYRSFEAYKEDIRQSCIEEEYEAYIDELVKKAVIVKRRCYRGVGIQS